MQGAGAERQHPHTLIGALVTVTISLPSPLWMHTSLPATTVFAGSPNRSSAARSLEKKRLSSASDAITMSRNRNVS